MSIFEWFKKQTFEGRISRHIGTVESIKRGMTKTKLKIDVLEPDESGIATVRIGFEVNALLSYESFGIRLSRESAAQLSRLLASAASS